MALGRGLGALISSTGPKNSNNSSNDLHRVWQVPVEKIVPNRKQPRKEFEPEALKELSDSIRIHGIIQPLVVVEDSNGGYELVAGERRLRASKMAGLKEVPVIVKNHLEDQAKLEIALIENIQRADLNSIEEAHAYRELADVFGLTQQAIADKVGRSRPAVANIMRLLDLPIEIQEALMAGKINTGQARALLTLDNREKQLDMMKSMLGQKMSIRDLERETVRQNPTRGRRDPNIMFLEEKLRLSLGTKVTISEKNGKGHVQVSFYSKDELKNLITKLTGEV
ncbi:MAG TPA: ParB/RepB/Spo0J family partition protein [Patescibacteria group bacterium]|nr:ParB/RepB/Spo0J family partition protein [Patescibacteria group bacterium]